MSITEAAFFREIPEYSTKADNEGILRAEKNRRDKVVVVLDDDPTGIQIGRVRLSRKRLPKNVAFLSIPTQER